VHPARLAVVTALYDQGRQLTATQAAQLAGLSPSAMSYHLRALERVGIIKRADAGADARERPWVRAGSDLIVRMEQQFSTAAVAATGALLVTAMDQDREALLGTMERRRNPAQQRPLDEFANYRRDSLVVTPDEARALAEELTAVLARYSSSQREIPPEGAYPLTVAISIVSEDPGIATVGSTR
jgi:DNA-binding transcriptional ArsR family regulator